MILLSHSDHYTVGTRAISFNVWSHVRHSESNSERKALTFIEHLRMMILWLVCRDLNITGPHENGLCTFFHPIKVPFQNTIMHINLQELF